ncbi:hypothetical protein E4L96_19920 [Massilia arenosa]|uniref:SIR2-like domain-containing protein n=1 Tax=Zemynaea arenosa TaxID=2561931 RepID=A0A4Y9RVP8_9BURK|nr:hypothetical protein [Massilia arenosa]TFW13367.1 hypothetical protein E4L96_19920 [Massilia arenosa]
MLTTHLKGQQSYWASTYASFSPAVINAGAGLLNTYFDGNRHPYNFEQFMSLLAFQGALYNTSLRDAFPEVANTDGRVLTFILHVLYDYFARAMSYPEEIPAGQSFWYQVNDKDRADAFRSGLQQFLRTHDATFVSFNYDAILESMMNGPSPDKMPYVPELSHGIPLAYPSRLINHYAMPNLGRYRNVTQVIKPHGSMHFFEVRDEMHQLLGGPRVAFVHTGLSSDFDPAKQQIDVERDRAWSLLRATPLIVPPVLNKDTYLASSYFREMLGLTYRAVSHANRIVVLGFSLPPSDMHMRALFESVRWSDKEVFLCYREGALDTTEDNWRSVARGATIRTVTREGIDVSTADQIESFWRSLE